MESLEDRFNCNLSIFYMPFPYEFLMLTLQAILFIVSNPNEGKVANKKHKRLT